MRRWQEGALSVGMETSASSGWDRGLRTERLLLRIPARNQTLLLEGERTGYLSYCVFSDILNAGSNSSVAIAVPQPDLSSSALLVLMYLCSTYCPVFCFKPYSPQPLFAPPSPERIRKSQEIEHFRGWVPPRPRITQAGSSWTAGPLIQIRRE